MDVNFRSALPQENRIFGGPAITSTTSLGGAAPPPPVPPRIQFNNPPMASSFNSPSSNYYGYGGGGYGGGFGGGYGAGGGYGSFGGLGGGGYGSGMFNSYSQGMYGSGMYGNRYGGGMGGGPGDVESRFIQMAEENSRPAFQSIESFVGVIGNFASMLDSTFFALSNSFRAILGVTANLGKLRSMFGQFLSSIALFRGLHWLWRKVLFTLHMSKSDPSSMMFKEAFNVAAANTQNGGLGDAFGGAAAAPGRVSAWPMIAFLSFIFATPYLIMKMVGRPDTAKLDEGKNPRTWQQPIPSQALHSFQATNAQELSVGAGEVVYVAPKEIQNQFRLMNTGWAIATKDFSTSGMVPISYLQRYSQHQPLRASPVVNSEQMNRIFDSATTNSAAMKDSGAAAETVVVGETGSEAVVDN